MQEFLKIYFECKEILDTTPIIERSTTTDTLNINRSNMAEFNLALTSKVLPTFQENYKETVSFVTLAELIGRKLFQSAKNVLISFVSSVKLFSNVKLSFKISRNPLQLVLYDLF